MALIGPAEKKVRERHEAVGALIAVIKTFVQLSEEPPARLEAATGGSNGKMMTAGSR
jgi:hypothetical protein